MKKTIVIVVSLVLAILITFGLSYSETIISAIDANINNNNSLVSQEIISYGKQEKLYNKLYANGQLVAVVSDLDYLNGLIKDKYKDYESIYPDTSLGLVDDCFITQEKSFIEFENVDDQIMNYLVVNKLLGIKTTAIEFSTSSGVYDMIYVKNVDDFYAARDRFLLNFISSDTLKKISNGEQISSPIELGTVEKSINLLETITTKDVIVNPDEIYSDPSSIYNYLCYGRNTNREYYTVKEGDTLQGVGYYFGDMSPKQIVMLNPDQLSSEDQVVTPGMELNVTYYTSPISVQVVKENLSQTFITPETPEYVEDESLEEGKTRIITQEELGIKNQLYKETWINGVLQDGELLSENVIKQPIRGKIAVGTMIVNMIGTGNYVWPVDNPSITCHYGCYLNHTGTDFVNKYDKYGPVYAVDSGVVDTVGYLDDMGNYCIINHQNGIRTFYMHLYSTAYVREGENVSRGEIIGQIGNTGRSEGAHLHLTFEVNSTRVNACNYLPCNLLG